MITFMQESPAQAEKASIGSSSATDQSIVVCKFIFVLTGVDFLVFFVEIKTGAVWRIENIISATVHSLTNRHP